MNQLVWLRCWRLGALLLLAISSALYVHYWAPTASGFCSVRSGCEAVRNSALGYLGHRALSLPLLGLLYYGGLLVLSLRSPPAPNRGAGRGRESAAESSGAQRGVGSSRRLPAPATLLFALSFLGAVGAAQLLLYQWLAVGAFCSLCIAVDCISLLLAPLAFFAARSQERGQTRLSAAGWLGLGAIAIAAPPAWTLARGETLPEAIQALHTPGGINVVEFSDFECPHCRRLHQTLAPLVEAQEGPVHLRRVHVPLPQHRMAEGAARAAVCAEAQGKGKAMEELLFTQPLSPESLSRMAENLGLDPVAYDRCLSAASTSQRLEQDRAIAEQEASLGLPTTYIGQRRIVGVVSGAALEEALEEAARQPGGRSPGPVVFWLGLSACIGLCVWGGRRPAAEGAG